MEVIDRRQTEKNFINNIRRNLILSAARDLFSEKSVNDTTIDEIAKNADLPKPTIYKYFKSKDEIVINLAVEVYDKFDNEVTKISIVDSKEGYFDYIYAALKAFLTYIYDNFEILDFMLDREDLQKTIADELKKDIPYHGEVMMKFANVIKDGIQKGYFRYGDYEKTGNMLYVYLMGRVAWLRNIKKVKGKVEDVNIDSILRYDIDIILR